MSCPIKTEHEISCQLEKSAKWSIRLGGSGIKKVFFLFHYPLIRPKHDAKERMEKVAFYMKENLE